MIRNFAVQNRRHDDLQLRLNALRSLPTIAIALGAERTREELLPFLQEIDDDEGEVFVVLAEQLGRGVSWVGGPAHAHALIGPLEELCNVEEVTVRDRAVEALRELIGRMPKEQAAQHICALAARLAGKEIAARVSACGLFAAALAKVDEAHQEELLELYVRLAKDPAHKVRCEAAIVLGGMAEVLQPGTLPWQELLAAFIHVSQDQQPMVRELCVSSCISLRRLRGTSEEDRGTLANVVFACAKDKSWPVRHTVADLMKPLCEVFDDEHLDALLDLYMKLLADPAAEVRTVAVARMPQVAATAPSSFVPRVAVALDSFLPPREQSQQVRASFASSVLALGPILGPALTDSYLMNELEGVCPRLIKDESSEVRLKLIISLGDLPDGTSINVKSLVPTIKELALDGPWRVRLAIINSMPSLAKLLGELHFTAELNVLLANWILDPVFYVRESAAASCRSLAELLGGTWFEENIVPMLYIAASHQNYLYRISATLCATMVAEVSQGPLLEKHLAPMAVKLASDPVPNVRFNAATAIKAMWRPCSTGCPAMAEGTLLPCLRSLVKDPDPDVQFFAEQALREAESLQPVHFA